MMLFIKFGVILKNNLGVIFQLNSNLVREVIYFNKKNTQVEKLRKK